MKIDPHKLPENEGLNRSTQNIQKSHGIEPQEKAGNTPGANKADKVDILSSGKEIADIMSAIIELPDVREKRVQAIKQRVEEGSYIIDPSKVAERILEEL